MSTDKIAKVYEDKAQQYSARLAELLAEKEKDPSCIYLQHCIDKLLKEYSNNNTKLGEARSVFYPLRNHFNTLLAVHKKERKERLAGYSYRYYKIEFLDWRRYEE